MNTREPATPVKSFPLLALAALFCLSSCDKVRTLAGQLGKKGRATASSTANAASSEIPQDVRAMITTGSSRIVIVDYYADWCGPCRQLSPILEKIAAENSSTVIVCKVNVDKHRELSTQQQVSSIPDVRIYQDGKLAEKFVGALPEPAVRKLIDGLVQRLPPAPPALDKAGDPAQPKPKEPAIRPMTKDWMPPGIQRR
jgi:thioredoxin